MAKLDCKNWVFEVVNPKVEETKVKETKVKETKVKKPRVAKRAEHKRWRVNWVLSLACLCAPLAAFAVPVVDQAQLTRNGENNVGSVWGVWAQTFTAGLTGQLTSIDIGTYTFNGADLDFRLTRLNALGAPDTGSVLANVSVGSASIGTAQQSTLSIDLTPFNIFVGVGDRLAYVIDSPNSLFGVRTLVLDFSPTGDPYAGGSVYHDTGSGFAPFAFTRDLFFRTFVDVNGSPPTTTIAAPASLALTLGGLLLLGLLRRRASLSVGV